MLVVDVDIPWLFYVVFKDNHSIYTVYDSKLGRWEGPVYIMTH